MRTIAEMRRTALLGTLAVLAGSTVAYAAHAVIAANAPGGADFVLRITAAGVSAPPSGASGSAKVTVVAGRAARYTVAMSTRSGFEGSVRLRAAGSWPGGLRARFSPVSLSRSSPSSTLTIQTSGDARRGVFILRVSARGSHGTRVVRAVVSVSDLAVDPESVDVVAGQRANVAVALRRTSDRQPTRLSASGLPAGVSATFSPRTTAGARATLTIATDVAHTTAGLSTVLVTARRGTRRATAQLRLRILTPDATPFGVQGSVDGLAPGVSRSLNLQLTNPHGDALLVTDLRAAVAAVSAPNATPQRPCTSEDFVVTAFSGGYPLRLPGDATRTLEQLGVAAAARPRVTMLNRPVNQDGCKGASVHLTFSGSASR